MIPPGSYKASFMGNWVIQDAVDPTKPHFILWNPESEKPPHVRLATLEEAQSAARKMANNFPGQTFHICQVQGQARTGDVEVKMFPVTKGGVGKKGGAR